MNPFEGMGRLLSALFGGDVWMLKPALNVPALWTLGLFAVVVGGLLVMVIYKLVPLIERHFEPTVMVVSYLAMGGIIFVEVVRRFGFDQQAPWSTTIPPFLFLIMTWVGCSYNVKLRTHLSFSEFRNAAPRPIQFALLMLDAVLWITFSWIVVVAGVRIVVNSMANFQIVLGTDNTMQWWFLISLPLSFILLAGRVFENVAKDIHNYRNDKPLIEQAVIGGDA